MQYLGYSFGVLTGRLHTGVVREGYNDFNSISFETANTIKYNTTLKGKLQNDFDNILYVQFLFSYNFLTATNYNLSFLWLST